MAHDRALTLYRWRDPPVIAAGLLALAAGVGQFGVVAALGSVAREFGHLAHGATIADQAGLSGTELGVGLAIIRLASIGSLPLAGWADRIGRRRMLLWTCSIGLALTVAASGSPTYWWFVALFAVGRPLLSATNGLAQVMAAEHTPSTERAKAVALIAAGYAVGAGAMAIIHSLTQTTLGFRGVFALAALPLLAMPLLSRRVVEPARFVTADPTVAQTPVLGAVGAAFRRRFLVICVLSFGLNVVTGPADSFLYLYAQNVEKLSGGVVSAMVVGAGIAGLIGLLLGRWLADRLGRRATSSITMALLIVLGTATYSGSRAAVVACYIFGVMAAATFAPAAGAFMNELFPTSVRASVAGWQLATGVLGAVVGLIAFGAVADVGNRFGVGAAATFLPVLPVVALLWLVPETKGKEPEQLWGSADGDRELRVEQVGHD